MRCFPNHSGPFFYERPAVCKCSECGQLVSDDDIRRSFGIFVRPDNPSDAAGVADDRATPQAPP